MTIDATWPQGPLSPTRYTGRARDVITGTRGAVPQCLAADELDAIADQRTLLSVSASRRGDTLGQLAGVRAGQQMRSMIDQVLGDERSAGTPLYLMLDDLAGTTLVSPWGVARWLEEAVPADLRREMTERVPEMTGVCIGFRAGTTALDANGKPRTEQNFSQVGALVDPADLTGWHELVTPKGMHFRRARRIDVWLEDRYIKMDASFQDSAQKPDGSRVAIHEYHVVAAAERDGGRLAEVRAIPGTLPYRECVAAPDNLSALIGTPLEHLRASVIETLRKDRGCTHLNDMMRSLAEAPALAAYLDRC